MVKRINNDPQNTIQTLKVEKHEPHQKKTGKQFLLNYCNC